MIEIIQSEENIIWLFKKMSFPENPNLFEGNHAFSDAESRRDHPSNLFVEEGPSNNVEFPPGVISAKLTLITSIVIRDKRNLLHVFFRLFYIFRHALESCKIVETLEQLAGLLNLLYIDLSVH